MDDRSSTRRILTREQLKTDKHLDAHNVTFLRWEKTLGFPKRFYLTSKMPVWWEHEVDAWLLARSQAEKTAPLTTKATAKWRADYQTDPKAYLEDKAESAKQKKENPAEWKADRKKRAEAKSAAKAGH